MQRQFLNQLIIWRAATFYKATARFRRTRVTAILCPRCQRWVKPRRCDRVLLICKRCVRQAVAMARGSFAHRRAALAMALARRRPAHDNETEEFRRHAARVTSTH